MDVDDQPIESNLLYFGCVLGKCQVLKICKVSIYIYPTSLPNNRVQHY